MEKQLLATLIQARTLQLYYHYCHNLVHGPAFHSDHAFFAASYAALELNYDSLAEYFISTFGIKKFKTTEITRLISEQLEDIKIEEMCCCDMYKKAQELEKQYYKYIEATNRQASLGLQNALQGMATEVDVRVYKIKQRLIETEEKKK